MVSNLYIENILKELSNFRGCLACDQLNGFTPEKNRVHQFVINTGTSSTPGEHFVYLELRPQKKPVFVDSFGVSTENKFIMDFMAKNGFHNYEYSKQQIQSIGSIYCGFFCIYIAQCRNAGHSLYKILSNFSRIDLESNDETCISLIEDLVPV